MCSTSCGMVLRTLSLLAAQCSQPVADLCKKKTVTAFTDGDRGGELIIKELLQVADVDFIARAPDGKGVEELVQKKS